MDELPFANYTAMNQARREALLLAGTSAITSQFVSLALRSASIIYPNLCGRVGKCLDNGIP